MINILDELVRVKAFQSKSEARMMIKNGGVSVIRSFHENAVPPCFKDKTVDSDNEFLTVSDEDFMLETKLGIALKEDKAKIYSLSNICFYDGFSMLADGTLFTVRILDNHGWDPTLARFRENLIHGTGKGIRFDCGWIMTWDLEKFGKNPWLINEKTELETELKNGDVINIGKKRTIVIGG